MKVDKGKGFDLLARNAAVRGRDTEVISYERPGKMILAQGSEVLHHVTPVASNQRR